MADSNKLDFSAYAFWSFALSIALLPIGLGGDRPIPFGIAQAGLAISCVCLAFSSTTLQSVPVFPRLFWSAGLMLCALAWAVFQTQPLLPPGWAHPLWQEASSVLQMPVTATISVVPEDSWKGLMRLVTYIMTGILAYVLAQDARQAKKLVTVFWISGMVICLYGLIIQVTGLQQILWYKKWAYEEDLTATFVNRNHFAVYCGMIMTMGLALMMQSWRRMMRNSKPHQRIQLVREWLLYQGLPRLTALALLGFCLALSHSRAGLVWSVAGVFAYIFFYQIYLKSWFRVLLVGFIGLLLLFGVLAMAFHFSERFDTLFDDYSSQGRSQVYNITWRAFLDNPWLGYGLNGFEPEYRLYQQYMYEEFNHAHSDLLESFLDYGVVAGAALWASIALLLSGLWHGIRKRRQDGMFPTLALAASVMVLGHSSVDFDLQIPGVVMTWSALLGLGLAQSWRQAEKQKSVAGEEN
jgi:O-antigen ligase